MTELSLALDEIGGQVTSEAGGNGEKEADESDELFNSLCRRDLTVVCDLEVIAAAEFDVDRRRKCRYSQWLSGRTCWEFN